MAIDKSLKCSTKGCNKKAFEGFYKCYDCLQQDFKASIKRKCLKCGKLFDSEDHKSNRICNDCKKGEDWRFGNDNEYMLHND